MNEAPVIITGGKARAPTDHASSSAKYEKIEAVRFQQGRYIIAGGGGKAYTANPSLMARDIRSAREKAKHYGEDYMWMLGGGLAFFVPSLIFSLLMIPFVEWPFIIQLVFGFLLVVWLGFYLISGSRGLRLANIIMIAEVIFIMAACLVFSIVHRDEKHTKHAWLYWALVISFTLETLWSIYFFLVMINYLHSFLIFTTVFTSASVCFRLGKNSEKGSQEVNASRSGAMLSSAIGADHSSQSWIKRGFEWVESKWTLRRQQQQPGTSVG